MPILDSNDSYDLIIQTTSSDLSQDGDSPVQILFSASVDGRLLLQEFGGVRLVVFESKLYYEVVDLHKNINLSIEIAKIEYGQDINLWITHDRRLYGK